MYEYEVCAFENAFSKMYLSVTAKNQGEAIHIFLEAFPKLSLNEYSISCRFIKKVV